jgi:four helix bundle protein
MVESIVKQKSYDFALRTVKLCQWLKDNKQFEISNQLLRCGTSIGANIEEALAGNSRKDFLYKMTIASKEARETNYWLRLLTDSGVLNDKQSQSMLEDSCELIKLLTSIVKTVRQQELNNLKLKTQN